MKLEYASCRALWILAMTLMVAVTLFSQENRKDPKAMLPNDRLKLDVPNFFCPTDKTATGGQPSLATLEEAAAQGYKTVVNLRTENEGTDLQAEAEKVRGLGMKYVHIPVRSDQPKAADAEAFLQTARAANNYPMFIHCGSGNRVGAFWMIHRVLDDRWSIERAEKEAVQIGMRSPTLKDFALKYIDQKRKQAP
ncbi:MAG: protein tyrosine phosphatase family protein [Acidobacteria bacterium]|nr:protein tyrosine phosphatase family protein [Acidobacteriota bacterium]